MTSTRVPYASWFPFLLLAWVAQQGNMLTYKFAASHYSLYSFFVYSFFFQAVINLFLVFLFKNRGFPIVLQGKMRWWVVWIALFYLLNELLFIYIYQIGGPYGLTIIIHSIATLLVYTFFGLLIAKEKLDTKQLFGVVFAFLAVILTKLG